MLNIPQVSVGMPVYNGAASIGSVLEDLLKDKYINLEILISDNGSTDGTEDICRDFARKNSRIQYFRSETNRGADWNFDRVLDMSNGKYFLWASHHDRRDRTFISECVGIMEREENVVLCYSEAEWLEEGGVRTGAVPRPFETRGMNTLRRFLRTIWAIGYCYQVYGVFRRATLMKSLRLKPKLAPDHLLLAELALFGEFACVPKQLFYVWRDADSVSIHKCFQRRNMQLTPRTALSAIHGMVGDHVRIVKSHVHGRFLKSILIGNTLVCMVIKYPRLFFGVFFSSFIKPGAGAGDA